MVLSPPHGFELPIPHMAAFDLMLRNLRDKAWCLRRSGETREIQASKNVFPCK